MVMPNPEQNSDSGISMHHFVDTAGVSNLSLYLPAEQGYYFVV